jgi:uncharacterized protein YhaN
VWLAGLRLERFGAFADRTLDGFTPGLNLLFGPNESGKTTLMMFLRATLFGFPARQKTLYDPLDGSDPGGILRLVDSQGQPWVVERRGRGRKARVTVSGPAGAPQGETALRQLLQNMTREVYENIFAFGLKELSEIATLNQREVQHLLYSASMGLGGVSLKAVEDDLDRQSGDLFKPRASSKEINLLLAKLGDTRKLISDLEDQPQEYQHLKAALQGLAADIRQLALARETASGEVRWLEKLRQGWNVWQELGRYQAELAALPDLGPFPADGLKRWEAAQANLAEVESQLAHWSGELARLGRQPVGPINRPLLEVAGAVRDLWDERALWRERVQKLRGQQAAEATAAARLADFLTALGPDWTETRLSQFNPPLSWQSALSQWPQRLEAAASEGGRAEDRARHWAEKLVDQETARDRAVHAGPWRDSHIFLWSFASLGLILALAAAGLFFYLPRPDLALLLAAGSGVAWLADLVYLVQMRLTHNRRLRELERDLEQTRGSDRAAAAAVDREQRRLEEVRTQWRRLLGEWSLDAELSPFAALEVLREVGKARSQLQELEEIHRAVQDLEEYLDGYSRRLTQVLAHLGAQPAAPEEINHTLEHLQGELEASNLNQTRHDQLAHQITETESHRDIWGSKAEKLRQELGRLLAAAGAPDEEDFRRRATLNQQRQDLDQNISRLGAQLNLLAGGPDNLARLQTDLGTTTRDDLEDRWRRGEARLQELDRSLAEAQQEQGKTKDRLENLERAEDLSRALFEEQILAARLDRAAQRWAVLTLGRHFLDLGRHRFEAEYQPQVLQRASESFAFLTGGRYQRVLATLEGEKFLVVNREGGHLAAEHLSRGAQEQLYLAMRFALVQEYSQGGCNLPLILDDILVNFDQLRARQAVLLLKEMSRSHQLLLFTCHPHVVALVQEALGPEAPMVMALEGSG